MKCKNVESCSVNLQHTDVETGNVKLCNVRSTSPVDKNRVSTRACLPGQPGIQIQLGRQITNFTKITQYTKYELWKLYKLQNIRLDLIYFRFSEYILALMVCCVQ